MQAKTIFVSGLLVAFATFSIGAIAADDPADAAKDKPAEPTMAKKTTEAKTKVKRHSHMEERTGIPLGFNRSMQHTRNCVSRRSVADEAKTEDLLHGNSEGIDVGALAER